jgi:hypothetical protein
MAVKDQTAKAEEKENAVAKTGATPTMSGLEGFAQFRKKGPAIGMEEASPEDVKMPKIKLAQAQSAEVADDKCKAGQFFNVTTGDVYDEIPCHLLSFGKGRVKWPEKFNRGDAAECKSIDGVIADNGNICEKCPDRIWADNERPRCGQTYSWMGVLQNGTPFRLFLAGAQISRNKDFITEVLRSGLPPFIFNVTLKSEKQKNDKGTYYAINFNFEKDDNGAFKTIDPSEFQSYADMTESMAVLFNKARAADLSKMDDGADFESGDPNGKGIF